MLPRGTLFAFAVFIMAASMLAIPARADEQRTDCANVLPDPFVHSILIDESTPLVPGCNVTILATIGNLGMTDVNCVVTLYQLDCISSCNGEGSDSTMGLPIDEERLIVPSNSTRTAQLTWTAIVGNNTLRVVVSEAIPFDKNPFNNREDITIYVHDSEATPGTNPGPMIKPVIPQQDDDGSDKVEAQPITGIMLYPKLMVIACTGVTMITLLPEFKKRFMFYIPILYTRLNKDRVLDNKLRARIYEYILANPGADYSTMLKTLNAKNGVLSYHLSILEKEMYIRSGKDGVFRRYYPARLGSIQPSIPEAKKAALGAIATSPGISQEAITRVIKTDKCTASYILLSLERDGLIKRKSVRKGVTCYPANT